MIETSLGYVPTDAQESVRKHGAGNLIVVAPPGCGKTEALALRAATLIESGLVRSPYKILAVTFSNRARDNLGSRIFQLVGPRRFRKFVTICNFHGLAARIFMSHANVIGIRADSVLMPQRPWLDETLGSVGARGNDKKSAKELLQWIKLSARSDAEVLEALSQCKNEFALKAEEIRQDESRLDYPDLLRHCQRILANVHVASLYRNHFSYVLVDEFQDLTPQQFDIVHSLSANNVTFAGDHGQAIYTFTGADPVAVEARIRSTDPTEYRLDESHRSSPRVLRVVNAVAAELSLPEVKCADPAKWTKGGFSASVAFENTDVEAHAVRRIAEAILDSQQNVSVGVVTRTDFRRSTIDSVFSEHFPWPVKRWKSAVTSVDTATLINRTLLAMGSLENVNVNDVVTRLVEEVSEKVDPADLESLEEIRVVGEWIRDQLEEGLDIYGAVRRIEISSDRAEPIGPGVHLLNAHVGKGQQFDWVVVAGMEEGAIPSYFARTESEIDEELRILLVMASRAKFGVVFTRSSQIDGKYGWWNRPASRWWKTVSVAAPLSGMANIIEGICSTTGDANP